jgi:hypothetical protein
MARGDTRTAYDLAGDLHQRWRERLGDDHEHRRAVAHYLAWALRVMGRYAESRDLAEDTLHRDRRIQGLDHPSTLAAAHNLAVDLRDLGEISAARDLAQDTLDRRRRVLGADHPETLRSASELASDLHALGELQAARELDQDTLHCSRRGLGKDHPSTLLSANNLARDLRALGEVQAARELDQDTLDRQRRVLGPDHPHTLRSANSLVLAATLSAHRSAAFGVYVLAALGGDDAADGRSSGCAVAGVVAVEEAGKHVDEFEQQRVDLGLLVSGVLGAVAGDEPVPSGGCLLFVLGGVVPGLVAGLPPAQGFGPVHGAGWCW